MKAISKAWFASTDALGRLNGWYRRRAERKSLAERSHDILLRLLTRRRPPIGFPVLLVVALAAIAWSASASAADCYRYGEIVTLSGHYFAKVAPADDGVARDPLTDAARRATLLKLTTSFCVDADIVSLGSPSAMSIQLSCPAIHPADGSALSIKGRLLGAHTGNGQTPVLLMCL